MIQGAHGGGKRERDGSGGKRPEKPKPLETFDLTENGWLWKMILLFLTSGSLGTLPTRSTGAAGARRWAEGLRDANHFLTEKRFTELAMGFVNDE